MTSYDVYDVINDVALVGVRGLEEDIPSKNGPILAPGMLPENGVQTAPCVCDMWWCFSWGRNNLILFVLMA